MPFSQPESLPRSGGEEPQTSGRSVAQSPLKRRSPASLSVRLRPNPSKRLKTSPTNREEAELEAMQAQNTLLESSSSARINSSKLPISVKRSKSAERWYNDTNKNVNSFRDADAFPDDDPPFYMHRTPLNLDSACAVPSDQSSENYRQQTLRVPSQGDSVGRTIEELRSVIDDLTVRNNKMKKKLKMYEKLHSSHLRKEILFEVRMHGLQTRWKRDLEQTLRSFTSTMEGASNSPKTMTVPPPTYLGPNPGEFSDKPSWSSDSYGKHVDSTYASISASGQTQISHTARHDGKPQERLVESVETHRVHFDSHLHDARQAFSLRKLRFVSVEAKQMVIVRRLEELFTDRLMSTIAGQVSLQQQVVSYSAAKAEVKASEAGYHSVEIEGAREATREARILTACAGLPIEGPVDDQAGTLGRDENDFDDPMGGDPIADVRRYPTIHQDPSAYIEPMDHLKLRLDLLPSAVSTTQRRPGRS